MGARRSIGKCLSTVTDWGVGTGGQRGRPRVLVTGACEEGFPTSGTPDLPPLLLTSYLSLFPSPIPGKSVKMDCNDRYIWEGRARAVARDGCAEVRKNLRLGGEEFWGLPFISQGVGHPSYVFK